MSLLILYQLTFTYCKINLNRFAALCNYIQKFTSCPLWTGISLEIHIKVTVDFVIFWIREFNIKSIIYIIQYTAKVRFWRVQDQTALSAYLVLFSGSWTNSFPSHQIRRELLTIVTQYTWKSLYNKRANLVDIHRV